MPVFRLDDRLVFPRPELAEEGPLGRRRGPEARAAPSRVLLVGIFPWYSEGEPILWHSPDPRMVLFGRRLHVGRSLRKVMARRPYRITLDSAFARVIAGLRRRAAAGAGRDVDHGRDGERLRGAARARGTPTRWRPGRVTTLVGGLYGVSLGRGVLRGVHVRRGRLMPPRWPS